MNTIPSFFPSRWPIMCAVMNGVSDLNLALAVHDAGAMPSLFIKLYDHDSPFLNIDLMNETLKQFVSYTGSTNIVLGMPEVSLLNFDCVRLINNYKVSHVELLGDSVFNSEYWNNPRFLLALKCLRTTTKIMDRVSHTPKDCEFIDAYCIKGSESAGVSGNISVSDSFNTQQKLTGGSAALIPYGGIGTPSDVRNYIERGAAAAAVGTLFAASKESCLGKDVKEAMCRSSSKNIVQLQGTGQNALILGNEEDVQNDQGGGWNRQNSLDAGIHGDGTQGHIYAGKSIDYVTSIKSVKEIVEYLTSELPLK